MTFIKNVINIILSSILIIKINSLQNLTFSLITQRLLIRVQFRKQVTFFMG